MPSRNFPSRLSAALCGLLAILFAAAPLAFSTDTSVGSLWIPFIGGFHPVLLHLPIGIVFLAVTLQLLRIWLPSIDRKILAIVWTLAALTASLSFLTGFLLGIEGGFNLEALTPHLWSAGAFTALCWACLALVLLGVRPVFAATLQLVCILSMVTVGHYGGVMVHGDPLAAAPWKPENQPLVFLPEVGEEVNAFHHVVQPILQAKCVSCHGHAKQRAGLRLDSLEFALLGSSHGRVIDPSDAGESELMKSLRYPINSDKHMPPKGKPQLNAAELSVIEWWIDKGANDQLAFSRQDAPEAITPFLVANYRFLPDPAAERRERERAAALREQRQQRRSELKAQLSRLPSDLRQHFQFSSADTDDLAFRCLTSPNAFDDARLNEVSHLLAECSEIDLSSAAITGDALAKLTFGPSLRSLRLNNLPIAADALACLDQATSLRSLSLFGSSVSDDAVVQLSALKSLHSLYLGNTNLSPASIATLQSALPDCEVVGTQKLTAVGASEDGPET